MNLNELYKMISCECAKRGYKFPLAILTQAVLESGWGLDSTLAKHNNFFGMKCGGNWKGSSINLRTMEEVNNSLISINDNFRTYETAQDGVIGYFNFINFSRYENLKNAINEYDYFLKLKADGWATDSGYVAKLTNIFQQLKERFNQCENISHESFPPYIEEFAKAVIRGEYGNGEERKEKIYKTVQSCVNYLLNKE